MYIITYNYYRYKFNGKYLVNLGKSEFDEMPLNAVKTHQGRSFRIALGKCNYLIVRVVVY